jgi:hypothetical protein
VYWHAVTYKTLIGYGLLLAGVIFAAVYFATPGFYAAAIKKLGNAVAGGDAEVAPLTSTQAKFVNLDGRVQVKKVNSVQWVDADYRTTLDKGDLIQTGSDGAARITFADTTSYTIKADTLVTVEENNVTRDQTTTAVRINTGAVDLSTASSPNSHTAVSVEDTVAQIRPNSRASVKSDPQSKEAEFTIASGSAQVQRGAEKIELGQWQRASVRSGSPISTSDVLAPPDLAQPLNLAPIITQVPKATPVHFEWHPVKDAVSYNLRISSTAMFTKLVKDLKLPGTTADGERVRRRRLFLERHRRGQQEANQRNQRDFQVLDCSAGQVAGNGAGNRRHAAARPRSRNLRQNGARSRIDCQRTAGAQHRF